MPSETSDQPSPKSSDRNEQYPSAPKVGFKDKREAYAARRKYFEERNRAIQERSKRS